MKSNRLYYNLFQQDIQAWTILGPFELVEQQGLISFKPHPLWKEFTTWFFRPKKPMGFQRLRSGFGETVGDAQNVGLPRFAMVDTPHDLSSGICSGIGDVPGSLLVG